MYSEQFSCLAVCNIFRLVALPGMLYVDVGIMVEEGVYVSSVEPGSAAAVDDAVTVGDRLLSVSSRFSFSHSPDHYCKQHI